MIQSLSHSDQHQRELTLIFGDELGIRGQELKDRDHGLAGLLADSLAVALDKLEAERQGIGILAGGGQGLGELELQVRVVGIGGQCRACGLDAAGLPGLEAERQLGLDLLGLGLEKPAPLQPEDPSLCLLEPTLLQRDSRQPDLRLGQLGVNCDRRAIFLFGRLRVGSLQCTSLRGERLGRRG